MWLTDISSCFVGFISFLLINLLYKNKFVLCSSTYLGQIQQKNPEIYKKSEMTLNSLA